MIASRVSQATGLALAGALLLSPAVAQDDVIDGPISGLLGIEAVKQPDPSAYSALAPMNGIGTAGWREAPWSAQRWQAPVLDPAEGLLGGDLWRGSDPETVLDLMAKLPTARDSATAFQLARRLVLSAAEPPAGVEGAPWLALRIERLAALGDLEGMERLLGLLPADQAPTLRRRVQVEVALMRSDRRELCGLSATAEEAGAPDHLWLKISTLCTVEQNDRPGTEKQLAALRSAGVEDGFTALVDALLHTMPSSAELSANLADDRLGALEAQLLNHFEFRVVRPLWHRITAAGRISLAFDRHSDLRIRTLAREWAASTGRLPGSAVARAYEDFSFFEEDLAAGVAGGQVLSGPVARAFAWQSLQAQSDPVDRLATVSWALEQARADGCYAGVARVLLPRLDFSPEGAAVPGVSDLAGRALYVMGHYEEATAWLLVARREGTISAHSANASWRLWPYARLAGLAMPNERTGLIAWRSTQQYDAEDELRAREALLLDLLRALGDGVSPGWIGAPETFSAEPAALPPDAMALQYASARGRLGETILRVLVSLDDRDSGLMPRGSVALAVEALDRIGLPLEARALAIEAANDAGI